MQMFLELGSNVSADVSEMSLQLYVLGTLVPATSL